MKLLINTLKLFYKWNTRKKWWGFQDSQPLNQSYIQLSVVIFFYYVSLIISTSMILNFDVFSYIVKDYMSNSSKALQSIVGLAIMFGPTVLIAALVHWKVKKKNIDLGRFEMTRKELYGYRVFIITSFLLPIILVFMIFKFW